MAATNVFPYFDDSQLARAFEHLKAMPASDGYLVHNEPRPAPESVARSLGMPLIQARSVLVTQTGPGKLYDAIVVLGGGGFSPEIPNLE
ncbi:MAG: hypothetical protein ACE15B_24035 [Bryobacteraceae bacterium]